MTEISFNFANAWNSWDRKVPQWAFDRLQEVMAHDMMTADRGDGEGRLRPSSLSGPCSRAKMLSFHGYRSEELPGGDHVLAELGTWNHYRQQLMGLSTGLLSDIEVPVSDRNLLLAGDIDGLTPSGVGVEIKTVHTDYYRRLFYKAEDEKEPVAKHLLQIHAYMRALGSDQFWLVYQNRSDGDLTEFTVDFDVTTNSLLDNVVTPLVAHANAGTLPDLLPLCKQMKGDIYHACLWKEACFREL